MKKINSAIAVCGLALCGCSATGATAEEVGLTDAQISSIASFFAAPIKSVATITPRYAAFGGATFTATDEVSSTARHSDLCLTGTKMPLLQSDVTSSPEGYVMLNTLGLDNVVDSTEITDDSNLPVAFAGNYDSGYKALAGITASNFSRYFTVETAEDVDKLAVFDPYAAEECPTFDKMVQAVAATSEAVPEDLHICGLSWGPITTAGYTMGTENMMFAMLFDPDMVKKLIDRITPLVSGMVTRQIEAGATVMWKG